jgi:hypothetical protein
MVLRTGKITVLNGDSDVVERVEDETDEGCVRDGERSEDAFHW